VAVLCCLTSSRPEARREAALTVIYKYPTITNEQLMAVMKTGIANVVKMQSGSGSSEGQRRLMKQLQAPSLGREDLR
jgi:hypothetical protein